MKVTDLRIYVEVYEMLKKMDTYIVNFKKEFKYSYGSALRETGIAIIRDICIANESVLDQSRRVVYLERAYGNYEAYKIMVRLAYNSKALTSKHCAIIGEHIAKIGAMIIKWKKNAQEKSKEYANAVAADDMVDNTDIEFLK